MRAVSGVRAVTVRGAWGVGLLAVAIAACSKDRAAPPPAPPADTVRMVTPAPDTTPQAASFLAFAHQSLAELAAPVTLGAWSQAHAGDTLNDAAPDYYEGPFCAASVRHARLPGGLVGVRYAFFYMVPPVDYPIPLPDSAVNRARDCSLGAIVVAVQAPPTIDTMLPGIEQDIRAQLHAGQSFTGDATAPFSTLPERWRTESGVIAFGRMDNRDPDAESPVPGPELIAAAATHSLDTLKALRLGMGTTAAWAAWRQSMSSGTREMLLVKAVETAAGDCQVNVDSLIRASQQYLPGATDSAMTAHLHFLLASAHAFKLDQDTTSRSHRLAAISHYRAAFALDPQRRFPSGRLSFFHLWRLIAGLQQTSNEFFNECGD